MKGLGHFAKVTRNPWRIISRHDQICIYNICRKPTPTAFAVGHRGDTNHGIIMSEHIDHQDFAMKLKALPPSAGLQSQMTSERVAGDGSSSFLHTHRSHGNLLGSTPLPERSL